MSGYLLQYSKHTLSQCENSGLGSNAEFSLGLCSGEGERAHSRSSIIPLTMQLRVAGEMEAMSHRFANVDIVQANERMVITDAFDPSCSINHHPPDLDGLVDAIRCVAEVPCCLIHPQDGLSSLEQSQR